MKDYNSMIKGKWGRPIGKGEASALSLAISNNGIIASNNLTDVKEIAKKHDIAMVTTSIILTALFEKKEISSAEVEKIWLEIQNRNTKLPKKSFKEYYTTLFKKDYEEFSLKKYYENLIRTE